MKCIVDCLLRMLCAESLVSDIGRACMMEVGYKYRCMVVKIQSCL